jgi:hypothetical protein
VAALTSAGEPRDGGLNREPRNGHAAAHGFRSSPTAMSFDPLMSFAMWTALGARIGRCANASCWWLGDWLAFGKAKYGRRYKAAIALTGLDYQTLRNYAVVSRRFEMSRRRDTLSFQHHAEVCALPHDDQERWLDRAAEHGWSRQALRRRVRASMSCTPSPHLFRLAVGEDQERRWREAASRSACNLEDWMVSTLDAAARPNGDGAVSARAARHDAPRPMSTA